MERIIKDQGLVCCKCNTAIVYSTIEFYKCPICGIIPKTYGDIIDFTQLEFKDKEAELDDLHEYIFVFSEPLTVTNIQYQELFYLLKKYTMFRNPVIGIAETVKQKRDKLSQYCTVEITPFEHSCFVRSNCDFDIKSIVKNSGYVHSAGDAIYVKEWNNVDTEDIIKELKKYSSDKNKKHELLFYTDQKLTESERKIEGIAIDYLRTYIGTNFFNKEIKVIESGIKNYCDEMGIKENGEPIFIYKDTWHITDKTFLYPEQNDKHYMIICQSFCKKENPLHDLDEKRPYWAGIYTTPHNLTSAMVNIAQIKKGDIIYDPFMHMGTTAIEAAKYDCYIIGSDIKEPVGALDNFNFVYNDNLDIVLKNITDLCDNNYYENCYKIANQEGNVINTPGSAFPDFLAIDEIIKQYPELEEYEKRLIFYMVRHYMLRQRQGIEEEIDLKSYIMKQNLEFQQYNEIRKYNLKHPNGWIPNENTSSFLKDHKYKSLRIGPYKNDSSKFRALKANARKFPFRDNYIDAIITDPPYGYGDDISFEELKKLYNDFISESFRVLKSEGRLVMCVLDKVKTGKRINSDIQTKGVISLITKVAAEKNIRFIDQGVLPLTPISNLSYWKSKHALNRSIIHLRISKKNGSGD